MQTIKEAVEKTVENYLNTDKFRDKSSKDDLELSFGQLIEKTIKEALENGFKLGVEFAQQWIPVEEEGYPESSLEEVLLVKWINSKGEQKYGLAKYFDLPFDSYEGKKYLNFTIQGSSWQKVTHYRHIELK